jgi:hypothetical protein
MTLFYIPHIFIYFDNLWKGDSYPHEALEDKNQWALSNSRIMMIFFIKAYLEIIWMMRKNMLKV